MQKTWAITTILIALAVGMGLALFLGINGKSTEISIPDNVEVPIARENTTRTDFVPLDDVSPPSVKDPSLRVELLATGMAQPTSMEFIGSHDLLILQKNDGKVRMIENGMLLRDPVFEVSVNRASERGLLGIAVDNSKNATKTVFLYLTEDDRSDTRNRVYRYEWTRTGGFRNGMLVLDLPGTPGPNHDGGKIKLGPDGMLYAVIGDLNRNGMLQNHPDGGTPDDSSVILQVDHIGNAGDPVLSDESGVVSENLARYYAYGIRNSFGLDFDPLTGTLWDTENGPNDYDEINLVEPGFNSGWEKIRGPIARSNNGESELVIFEGSQYRDPVFSLLNAQGLTDIEFFNSSRLGGEYANNIFVGDINNGNLYFFTMNNERNGLTFDSAKDPGLADLVADNRQELDSITFGKGFRGITDIETGPDGDLYVLSYSGNLYRIVPSP